jgi:hypothetical protein
MTGRGWINRIGRLYRWKRFEWLKRLRLNELGRFNGGDRLKRLERLTGLNGFGRLNRWNGI